MPLVVVLFIVFCSALLGLVHNISLRTSRPTTSWVLFLAFSLALSGGWATPSTGAQSATTTTLAVTSGGSAATSVSSGSVVTLTAAVKAGATPVTVGLVNFCDASATSCTDIHILGTAQLTSAGTAVYKLRPGIGSHSYKAVFHGTRTSASSLSGAAALTVTGKHATATMIAQSGNPGAYTLTATVAGIINAPGLHAPTGSVSFMDTNSNSALGNIAVSSGTVQLALAGSFISATVPGFGIATADFNGDGIPDLAVGAANDDLTALSILLGNGDGTFTATPANPVVGNYPYSVMAGDFNSDGIPDLAVGNVDDNTVSILLGRGDGSFTAKPNFNLGDSPQALATADFNGDGIPDLAVVLRTAVLVFDGNGDGTFHQIADVLGTGNFLTQGIAIGDLNGDGIADIVVADDAGSASVTVFLGKVDGTFNGGTDFGSGSTAVSVAIADFNRDGIPDLVVTDYLDDTFSIFLGNGNGTFKTPVPYSIPLFNLQSVTAADFNGDGIADLAIASGYPTSVALLPGNGDGTFGTPVYAYVDGFYPSGLFAIADFNGDGLPDIAEPDQITSNVAIFLNQQSQTVTATLSNVNPSGPGAQLVEASYPGDGNFSPSISGTTSLTPVVATPALSLASGPYTSVQTLSISDATPGATIYYSASGIFDASGFVPYTAPIQLAFGGSEFIAAYATETGYQQSESTTANYYLNLPIAPAPVFSPAAGTYAGVQSVTISDAAPGATFYYTTNGSLPTTNSTQYTGPIAVTTSETLVAMAVASGYSTSAPTAAQFLIGSSPSSFIYTIAGNGSSGYSGDGGMATAATLNMPSASVRDAVGNLYIADTYNQVIRKVAAGTGTITTFAGTGTAGYSGDNGAATSAELSYPGGLSIDGSGNLYFADENNQVVRMVSANTGAITTIAGNGTAGFGGDGGAAVSAQLFFPSGTAIDVAGNLYIADSDNHRIRKVVISTGVITTVAGNGSSGYTGDGAAATSAEFGDPLGVATDGKGNLYVVDWLFNVVREVNAATGVISTVAGNGSNPYSDPAGGYSGDGGPATIAQLSRPFAATVDAAGNVYIADSQNQVIRKVTAATGIITTVVGNASGSACNSLGGDGGPATNVALCNPQGISVDTSGNLYIADTSYDGIRLATVASVPPTSQTAPPAFTVPADTYASPQVVTITDSTPGAAIYVTLDGSAPSTAGAGYKGPIAVSGRLAINAIAVAPGYLTSGPVTGAYSITSPPSSVITTIAGSGVSGFSGAGGAATSAQVSYPSGVAVDSVGNVYFTDIGNNVIWEVAATTGTISIVAGTGIPGYSGDGGPAASAQLYSPSGIALDIANNLYVADTFNNCIRKITASTAVITTVAGQCGSNNPGNIGDGGPATAAYLGSPSGLALDSSGDLFIADTNDNLVRMVSASTGIITTVAGNGNYTYSGDGGQAASAGVDQPNAVALDTVGNLYISTPQSGRIRKVSASTGIITTVAGNGNSNGSTGDGGLATKAEIGPQALAIDPTGNLYLADSPDSVREVSVATGVIARVAGNGYYGYFGDENAAMVAELAHPTGIALDASGSLYIADQNNFRIRKVSTPAPTATPIVSPASGNYSSAQMATITDSSTGAIIYYTTDGTTPTNTSNVYSGPVAISATTTLQAIAIAPGLGQSAVASAKYTIQLPVAPTVTATPSATSITTAQSLSVVVTVAGPSGSPAPTGSVALSSGSYSAPSTNLANGGATITIPPGGLTVGADTLTASYAPDSSSSSAYTNATGATSAITVTQAKSTPTVSVTPSATSITTAQSLTVTVGVSGSADSPRPTGSVTLSGGGYSSPSATLANGSVTITIAPGGLTVGTDTLTASYAPDSSSSSAYTNATGATSAITVTQSKSTPTMSVTPSATSITTAQSLTVTVGVSGSAGSPAATGSVTLSSGGYSATRNLASGSATFDIAAGTLPVGTNTLTAIFTPDAAGGVYFTSTTQSAIVKITQAIGPGSATVALTPSVTSITDEQQVSVAVSVTGASGQPTPTGLVTLAGGSYSAQQSLSGGSTTFSIPAGAISEGANTLTGNYAGDINYAAASGTTTVRVVPVLVAAPNPTPVAPGDSTTATATFSAGSTYSGTMNLTCTLTASPTGAQSLPTCSLSPTSVTITSGGTATATVTVNTTAASSGSTLLSPGRQVWKTLSGGGMLAVALLLGVPSWRRRKELMMVALFGVAVAGMIGCGGGGGPTTTPPPVTTPATTAGTYTFSVIGTDSSSTKITASTNVTVTVK